MAPSLTPRPDAVQSAPRDGAPQRIVALGDRTAFLGDIQRTAKHQIRRAGHDEPDQPADVDSAESPGRRPGIDIRKDEKWQCGEKPEDISEESASTPCTVDAARHE